MKNVILILAFICLACGNRNSDKFIISSFIEKVIVNNDYSAKTLGEFMNLENTVNSTGDAPLVKPLGTAYNKLLQDNDYNYKIILHREAVNAGLLSDLEIEVSGFKNVYYLIVQGDIVAPFIIEDKKIISMAFLPSKTESSKKRKPWIF